MVFPGRIPPNAKDNESLPNVEPEHAISYGNSKLFEWQVIPNWAETRVALFRHVTSMHACAGTSLPYAGTTLRSFPPTL
jgi:hypothetical protein